MHLITLAKNNGYDDAYAFCAALASGSVEGDRPAKRGKILAPYEEGEGRQQEIARALAAVAGLPLELQAGIWSNYVQSA